MDLKEVISKIVDSCLNESPVDVSNFMSEALSEKASIIVEEHRKSVAKLMFGEEEVDTDAEENDDSSELEDEEDLGEMTLEEFISKNELDEAKLGKTTYNPAPKMAKALEAKGFKRVQTSSKNNHGIYHYTDDHGRHAIISHEGYKLRNAQGKVVKGQHHKQLSNAIEKSLVA